MDTTAYLTRQGWAGAGHTLQTHNRGLARPLLVSSKNNSLGIGKKKQGHDAQADQWWARAFDKGLKALDVGGPGRVGKIEGGKGGGAGVGVEAGALEMVTLGGSAGVWKGGLYGNFVRGEGLGGTIGVKGKVDGVVEGEGAGAGGGANVGDSGKRKRKRKRKRERHIVEETKEERRKRRKERTAISQDIAPSADPTRPEKASDQKTTSEYRRKKLDRRMLRAAHLRTGETFVPNHSSLIAVQDFGVVNVDKDTGRRLEKLEPKEQSIIIPGVTTGELAGVSQDIPLLAHEESPQKSKAELVRKREKAERKRRKEVKRALTIGGVNSTTDVSPAGEDVNSPDTHTAIKKKKRREG
ncbi:MAG: hypothetical protein M1827_001239 [Pycnora praestabilis]|nr:MAG: hypothetical protein M1827_001239 [Pycnora praestabilis]